MLIQTKKVMLRIGLIAIVTAVLPTPAIASNTDYDGIWDLQISCSGGSIELYTINRKTGVLQGTANFEVIQKRDGGVASGTFQFTGQKVSIRITSTTNSWQVRVQGSVVTDTTLSGKGNDFFNGSFQRTCTARGVLSTPAASSIAGINNAVKNSMQTTAGDNNPSPVSSTPVNDGLHSDWVNPMSTRSSAHAETVRQRAARAAQVQGQTQSPAPAKPNPSPSPKVEKDNQLSAQEVRSRAAPFYVWKTSSFSLKSRSHHEKNINLQFDLLNYNTFMGSESMPSSGRRIIFLLNRKK